MHLHRAATLVALLALSACSSSDDESFAKVAIGTSPANGPADAWVTIVEFDDFQCPYCSRGAETMRQLQQAYGNDLRLVFKHMPLKMHEHAMDAAVAAECAHEQSLFWPMYDQLFANQSALASEDLERYAAALGRAFIRVNHAVMFLSCGFIGCPTPAAKSRKQKSMISARVKRSPQTYCLPLINQVC
jgi:hypothetical protein